MTVPDSRNLPGWSVKIEQLLGKHALTQAALAQRLGVSPTTISRWIRGTHEPTGAAYVSLGNLAGPPEDLYFWERAGIDVAEFPQVRAKRPSSSVKVRLTDFSLLAGRRLSSRILTAKADAVAIPLMNLTAYGDSIPPNQNVRLSEAVVEEIIIAPMSWCEHPEEMICMHVAGDSMSPLIPSGSIIAVDTHLTDVAVLQDRVVLAQHRDLGYKIARLSRLPSTDVLFSVNTRYAPIDLSDEPEWKISGRVLWWITRDPAMDS